MKWIKNLFKTPENVTLTIDQLPDWFRQETRGKLESLEKDSDSLKTEIKKETEEVLQSLTKLEQAKLKNENIQPRALQFMTGNRENYIRQITFFVKQIPYEQEPRELCKTLKESLQSLSKASARSYAILQEFFADESREVVYHLSKIDKLVTKIDEKANDSNLKEINQAKDIINELFRQIELNNKRKIEIEELKKQIKETINKKEQHEQILEKLEKSEEYAEFKELQQRIKDAELSKVRIVDEITQTFSPLIKALKKYQKMAFENQNVIELYTTDLCKALNADTQWNIILILQNIERMLKDNALELKEDKIDRVKEAIKVINKQLLTEYKQKLNFAMADKTGAEEHLKNNRALEKKAILDTNLINLNTSINNLTVRMNTSTHELEGPTVKNLKDKLIKHLVSISGKGVTLE